jgi:hypothetical protein
LEVRVVVCAIAGVAIMAAMTIAPYRCDLMFRLRVSYRTTGTLMLPPGLLFSEAVQAVSKKLLRAMLAGGLNRYAVPIARMARQRCASPGRKASAPASQRAPRLRTATAPDLRLARGAARHAPPATTEILETWRLETHPAAGRQ